jgi:hypothetical protein
MYIPVWGYRIVEHYLCPVKKDSKQTTAVFRKSQNVTEHNSAPRRGHERVWPFQYSLAIVKKSYNTAEVYIRNNSPWTNMNSNVCEQNT